MLRSLRLAFLRERRAEVLRVLAYLAYGLGAQSRSAFGEGVHLSDACVRGGRESHGLGVRLGLLGEVVGGGLQRFGDVGGGGDNQAGGHCSFGDEAAATVGGVHGHF